MMKCFDQFPHSEYSFIHGCYFQAKREINMHKTITLAGLTLLIAAGTACADPIEGTWKRSSTGTLIKYAGSGGKYCGTVMSGKYKGKSIGCMSGANGSYKGSVNKLDEGKTYSGKATVKGNTMTLSGCVLGGIICKSEKMSRQ